MSYNIRYDTPEDDLDQWEYRKEYLVSLVKQYEPTIIGFQEVLFSQKEFLQDSLPEWSCVGAGRNDGMNDGEFNPIFYHRNEVSCLDSGTFWLSHTPYHWGSKLESSFLPRICTWAKLEEHGTTGAFYCFNTHLDHLSSTARIEQTQILLHCIQEIAGLHPSVLMGDFNCNGGSNPYKIIATSFFEDTLHVSEEPPVNSTLMSFTGFHHPIPPNQTKVPKGIMNINHIFVSGFTTLSWHLSTEVTPCGRAISDHRAIITSISNKYSRPTTP